MYCIYRKGSSIQCVLAATLNTLMLFCIPAYHLVKGQLLSLQITGVFLLQIIGTHKLQILGTHREIFRWDTPPMEIYQIFLSSC